MIVTFEGRMGQGKTAAAVSLARQEHLINGRKIFSTAHLYSTVTCPVCPEILVEIPARHKIYKTEEHEWYDCPERGQQELTEADEIERIKYTWLTLETFYKLFREAENGQRTLSQCIFLLDEAYLFNDSRRSGSKINLLFNSFTMQTRKRGVDMYLTAHDTARLDKRLRAAIDLKIICRFNPTTEVITLRMRDMHTGVRRRLKLYGPAVAFPFYDTEEIVVPQSKLFRIAEEDLR